MILILTTEAGDFSHPKFIDWLEHYHADYEILTGESVFYGRTRLNIVNNDIYINGRNYSKDVTVVFNRRWLTAKEVPVISENKLLNKGLKNTISSELYELRNYLYKNLKNTVWIPNLENLNINKINVLEIAKEVGLLVPNFIVTNQKKELTKFFNNHKSIVTKAIGNFPRNYVNKNFLLNPIYTKIVSKELIKKLPNIFFMSMFQEYIIKRAEYRVLYFGGKCYTVELLTQENDYSKVDSREKKDDTSEIRIQKSKLPSFYEKKIKNLMTRIGLNVGCIDVIESLNNGLFFLEVNPVGQISGYSERGNLGFEKTIVEKMIKIDNESRAKK